MNLFPIKVSARDSKLSQVQAKEVLLELQKVYPQASFDPLFIKSHGDIDLKTSLRELNQTDFFTREIDALVLNDTCQIAIHSAKDLPETLPQGLKIIALTRGIDPSDSLVLREFDTLETLRSNALIATSSIRREEAVKQLRKDFTFRDLRGTIHARLDLLQKGEADGVVIAEAALLRLNLGHLNRIRIPGDTTPKQGQLAIIAKEENTAMETLFTPLDSRKMKRALYFGPEFPLNAFPGRKITHSPLIEIMPRSANLEDWPHFTHLILTSKSAVKTLVQLLRKNKIPPATMQKKTVIAVGKVTGSYLLAHGITPLIAKTETAEGIVHLLEQMSLEHAYLFWPHSSLSRPLIEQHLKQRGASFYSCVLYDTHFIDKPTIPELLDFEEILFSSPSTVSAFFKAHPNPPKHLTFSAIGTVTGETLEQYTAFDQNKKYT